MFNRMDKKLIFILIIFLIGARPVNTRCPMGSNTNGLVALWPMDRDVDPISDITKNGNTGAASGSPANGTGKFTNCEFLDGANEFFTIANESNFDFDNTDPFSISCWMNADLTQYSAICGKSKAVANYSGFYCLLHDNGKIFFRLLGSGSGSDEISTLTTNVVITANTWHFVVFTYDGSSAVAGLKIYVDGALKPDTDDETDTLTSILNNEALAIGRIRVAAEVYGRSIKIDDMAVFNRELPVEEIAAEYYKQVHIYGI